MRFAAHFSGDTISWSNVYFRSSNVFVCVLITAFSLGPLCLIDMHLQRSRPRPGRNSSVTRSIFGEREETGQWIAKSRSDGPYESRVLGDYSYLLQSYIFFNDTTNERADSGRAKEKSSGPHER